MIKNASIVAILLLTSGCTAIPTRNEMRRANYGPPVTQAEFEKAVRYGMDFYDPYSAVIRCSTPKRGWGDYLYKTKYGWLSHCTYNAKNLMGGYVGEVRETFLISNGALYDIFPTDWKYLD